MRTPEEVRATQRLFGHPPHFVLLVMCLDTKNDDVAELMEREAVAVCQHLRLVEPHSAVVKQPLALLQKSSRMVRPSRIAEGAVTHMDRK